MGAGPPNPRISPRRARRVGKSYRPAANSRPSGSVNGADGCTRCTTRSGAPSSVSCVNADSVVANSALTPPAGAEQRSAVGRSTHVAFAPLRTRRAAATTSRGGAISARTAAGVIHWPYAGAPGVARASSSACTMSKFDAGRPIVKTTAASSGVGPTSANSALSNVERVCAAASAAAAAARATARIARESAMHANVVIVPCSNNNNNNTQVTGSATQVRIGNFNSRCGQS